MDYGLVWVDRIKNKRLRLNKLDARWTGTGMGRPNKEQTSTP